MQRSQSSGRMSSTLAVGPAMPALLTSTSSRRDGAARPRTALDVAQVGHVGAAVGNGFRQLGERGPVHVADVHARPMVKERFARFTRPIPAAPAVTRTRSPWQRVSCVIIAPRLSGEARFAKTIKKSEAPV